MRKRYLKKYVITNDSDMLAPKWLVDRMNHNSIEFVYKLVDGYSKLKGVRIHDQVAKIGDVLVFNGKRISIERR